MALSQKEIKRIEVMELLAGGKWFCPQIRRAPTLSLRRVDVDFLFAHREMRKMDCGGSISYKGRTYAPNTPEKASMARSDVDVRESLSGKIWVIHKGCRIEMREVEKAERAAPSNATKGNEGEPAKTHTPAPNHPWKQSFQEKRSPWLSEECLKDGFSLAVDRVESFNFTGNF